MTTSLSTSQNGYPAAKDRTAIGVRTFTVPGTPVQLAVRGDVAPLLLDMARWFSIHVEALKPATCFGYAFRTIAGSHTLSNHASGTAIDLNSDVHPQGKRTIPVSKRASISAKAKQLGLRWGGDFTTTVDEMHFEVNVPLDKALSLIHSLGLPAPVSHPTLHKGAKGQAVKDLQTALNHAMPDRPALTVDSVFGAKTDGAVREFQHRKHLTVDGIVGPLTWGKLTG